MSVRLLVHDLSFFQPAYHVCPQSRLFVRLTACFPVCLSVFCLRVWHVFPACPQTRLSVNWSVFLPIYLSFCLFSVFLPAVFCLSFCIPCLSPPRLSAYLSVSLHCVHSCLSACLTFFCLPSSQLPCLSQPCPSVSFFDCLFYLSNIYLFYVVQACIPSLPWLSTSSLFLQSGSLSGCLPD